MDYQNWKRPEELVSCPVLHMRNSTPQLMNELSVKLVKNPGLEFESPDAKFLLHQLIFLIALIRGRDID